MTIIGNPLAFAVEVEFESSSPRSFRTGFGLFRYWIAGHSFGLPQKDSTAFLNCYAQLESNYAGRKNCNKLWNSDVAGREILVQVYLYLYGEPELEHSSQNTFTSRALILAPNGEQAFDDGSLVVAFEDEDCTRIVGGKILSGEEICENALSEEFCDVKVDSSVFYECLRNAMKFLLVPPI